MKFLTLALVIGQVWVCSAWALKIEVDYRYDSNNFFSASGNPQGAEGAAQARASVAAAAARWGAIIDQPLAAVSLTDDIDDVRIGFIHPGKGENWQASSARSAATDSLVREINRPAANEYRGAWSIPADTWILYIGARDISPDFGEGGTALGLNWTSVLNDPAGVHNRGFNGKSSTGAPSLPVWGGFLAVNSGPNMKWNFNHQVPPGPEETDFYTIVLHEMGHALGLNTGFWYDWETLLDRSGQFVGSNAVEAYNADNGAGVTTLALDVSQHWDRGRYKSYIFHGAKANYVGTVGIGIFQLLLLEPNIPNGVRTEITNIDVGALADLGWGVIEPEVSVPMVARDLQISRNGSGAVQLMWTSQVGASYTVQVGDDLSEWSGVSPAVTAISTQSVWVDRTEGFGRRFYRVVSN